ncbi:unnamed protein product [Alternaria alternata]
MPGRKRAASPSGGASAVKKTKKKKLLVILHVVYRPGIFPFLRLPAEIRNMIYHYVFYGTATIQQKKGQVPVGRERNISKRPTKPPMDSPNLSLLYVSRQLHHETALLPYMLTIFYIYIWSFGFGLRRALASFLKKRSSTQIEALSNLRVCHWSWVESTWVKRSGNGSYWVEMLGLAEPSSKRLSK